MFSQELLAGFASVFLSGSCLFYCAAGTIIGIIFGSIPGLSTSMAMVLFLPLSFALDTTHGVALLIGLFTGGMSGGLISAILLKMPGTPAAVSTVFDGAPMAERGEGGRAIGIGILYSFIGGAFSILALVLLAPQLSALALKFTSVDYVAVYVFAMTIIGGLSGKSILNGLVSGCFGLLLGCVGVAPLDSLNRLTFGVRKLNSGISEIALIIGFYAVAEVFAYAFNFQNEQLRVRAKTVKIQGFGIKIKEFFHNLRCMIVSSVIGIVIGILPGIGGGVAGLVSYSVNKSVSKDGDKFGTGIAEGVIASETANNATIGSSIIPMLTMGIPGSTTAALLMSGLIIKGVTPGPLILQKNGELVYAIYAALLVTNLMMLVFERLGINLFVKVLDIPRNILLPVVLCLCTVGAFSNANNTFEVFLVFVIGVIAWLMNKAKIPLSPCLIGFILGSDFETELRQSIIAGHGDLSVLVSRPIACGFLVAALVSILLIAWQRYRSEKKAKAA